jgi:hypothetical protein
MWDCLQCGTQNRDDRDHCWKCSTIKGMLQDKDDEDSRLQAADRLMSRTLINGKPLSINQNTETSTQPSSQQPIPKFFWVMIGIVVCLCIMALPMAIPKHWSFENRIELKRIRKELPLAEARWNSHNITDYDIDVVGVVHPNGFCSHFDPKTNSISPIHLKIRQGKVVFDNDVSKDLVEGPFCFINDVLPPKVFDNIRQIIEGKKPAGGYLKIEFDPEYGFVSDYYLTSNSRRSSLLVHYTFSNFRLKGP